MEAQGWQQTDTSKSARRVLKTAIPCPLNKQGPFSQNHQVKLGIDHPRTDGMSAAATSVAGACWQATPRAWCGDTWCLVRPANKRLVQAATFTIHWPTGPVANGCRQQTRNWC
jgi:hypothetical protein